MKNKDFFHQQYDKVNWHNQDKTKINSFIYGFILDNLVSDNGKESVSVFDIGFGVGLFLRMSAKSLSGRFSKVLLEGCEPSYKNYEHFRMNPFNFKNVSLRTFNETFLGTRTETKFDYLVSSYSFTAFVFEDLSESVRKVSSMLKDNGKLIMVVSEENYLTKKLMEKRDLFIEENELKFNGKNYKEYLHYTEIPLIGTIIDYNKEEKFYEDFFKAHGFNVEMKKNIDDNGFIATIFVFSKSKD